MSSVFDSPSLSDFDDFSHDAHLGALEKLRVGFWEKPLAYQNHATVSLDGRDVEYDYLDLSEHMDILRALYLPVEDKLLIRREYVEAIDLFTKESNETGIHRPGGRMVTGHPGTGTCPQCTSIDCHLEQYLFLTGQTSFLIYALVESLRRGRPVALQTQATCYTLFTSHGTKIFASTERVALAEHNLVWTLSNVDGEPASGFISATRHSYIVQAASPRERDWKPWSEMYRGRVYVMHVWSLDELSCLACVYIVHAEDDGLNAFIVDTCSTWMERALSP